MQNFIAFRTKDADGDVWAEKCFLFKDEGDVNAFFDPGNIGLVQHFTDFETGREVRDFKVQEVRGHKTYIEFETTYSGLVRIYRMYAGHVVSLI